MGLGFRVLGLGFRPGFRVKGLGFTVGFGAYSTSILSTGCKRHFGSYADGSREVYFFALLRTWAIDS